MGFRPLGPGPAGSVSGPISGTVFVKPRGGIDLVGIDRTQTRRVAALLFVVDAELALLAATTTPAAPAPAPTAPAATGLIVALRRHIAVLARLRIAVLVVRVLGLTGSRRAFRPRLMRGGLAVRLAVLARLATGAAASPPAARALTVDASANSSTTSADSASSFVVSAPRERGRMSRPSVPRTSPQAVKTIAEVTDRRSRRRAAAE